MPPVFNEGQCPTYTSIQIVQDVNYHISALLVYNYNLNSKIGISFATIPGRQKFTKFVFCQRSASDPEERSHATLPQCHCLTFCLTLCPQIS